MTPFHGAKIVLGVSGGIAAYKAADLASQLVQAGATVDTVLTAGASEFVQPLTFAAITKRPVHTSVFEPWTDHSFGHITLAAEACLLVIAPASANTMARLALGLADDLLGTIALATTAPILIAPAMEHGMFHHPATQEHLATLLQRGVTIVGPEHGRLASGHHGDGRLAPVSTIVGAARLLLGTSRNLTGRKVVVTAGGTHEPIDPIRYIGNRSSGAMGYALAQAALDEGASVTLVAGPTHLVPPYGVDVVHVTTAEEMLTAVTASTEDADVLIMAAAVADFRPPAAAPSKIKKQRDDAGLTLELVRNPDILATVTWPQLLKIGFAAETEDLEANAAEKLRAKGLALIIANDAVSTIGGRDSTATLIAADLSPERLPTMSKDDLAKQIIDRVVSLLARRESTQADA